MTPGELFHHIVVHEERAAHHCHNEVRDGQVGDEQVGEVSELLVARQRGDEYEVSQTAHEHDADEHHADNYGGHKEGLALRGVREVIGMDAVIHVVVVHRVFRLARGQTLLHVLISDTNAADVGVAHV